MTRTFVTKSAEQFYVRNDGTFVAAIGGLALPLKDDADTYDYLYSLEDDWIEVPFPPENIAQIWSFTSKKYLSVANDTVHFKPIPRYDFWRAVDEGLKLKKDQVLAAIETSDLDDDAKYHAKLGITDAQTYIRDDPNVVSLLSLMGFPAHEADDFWLWAQPA